MEFDPAVSVTIKENTHILWLKWARVTPRDPDGRGIDASACLRFQAAS